MNKVIDIYELKDSHLVYKKDVPFFGYFIIIIVFAFICTGLIWSTKTHRPYIVVASGVIQDIDKNYIESEFGGEIYEVKMKEGQNVKKGQILFKIKNKDIDIQIEQLKEQKLENSNIIKKYTLLIKSIKDDKNYFSSKNERDSLYFSQYKVYEYQMDQQVVNADTLKDTGYTDKEIENAKINNEKIKGQIKYEAINNAANSRKQYEQENSTIDSQIQAMEKRKENYTIKATSSGRLHMLDMYKPGMTVQAGAPIASISNMGKATAIIDATISASDRSRIRVGNNVSILVLGLQQNVYGTLKGKVVEIDSDISISNDGKKSFFKIKIEPDSIVLNPKDGEMVELKNGMAVEARIIYDKITYFDYAMNAIGIKHRIN